MAAATDQSNQTHPRSGGPADAGTGTGKVVELHAAIDMLVGADLGSCTHRDLEVLRGATQRLRSFAAAADVRIARRNDQLWADERGTGSGSGAGSGSGDAGSAGGPGGSPGAGPGDGDAGGGGAGDGGERDGGRPGDPEAIGGARDRRGEGEDERDRGRARVGELMASFEAALEAGEIDVAHVDALVAAVRRLEADEVLAAFLVHEASLLGYAKVERPDRFRRRCTDLVRRILRDHGIRDAERKRRAANVRQWWDHRNGMGHMHVELDEERYEKLMAALDAKVDELRGRASSAEMTFQQLRAEAFVELVTASSALGVRPAEVQVLIDYDTLRTGVFGATSLSETASGLPLTPETVRRHACDGGIIPVVMGGDGVPLDVGRKRRLATRAQRSALRAMYATCAHPRCSRPFSWCRIHHIVWWDLFGRSDLDNLLPLCDHHHHQVHEGGWSLTMTPDRVTTWATPGGDIWFVGDTRDAAPATWNDPTAGPPTGGDATGGDATGGDATGGDATGGDATGGGSAGTRPVGEMVDGCDDHPSHDHDSADTADAAVAAGARRRAKRCTGDGAASALFAHDVEPAGP